MAGNTRTEEFLKSFKPMIAIMVYQANGNEYYLESHSINDKGQILEGKPLLQETIQEVVDVFYRDNESKIKIGGIVPQNLLSCKIENGGNYSMIWYRPAEIRLMHFKEELGLPIAKAWVPPMIYVVERKSLYVYALLDDDRPTDKTKLYRAPFPNVAETGSVCLGSARVKKHENNYEAIIQYWEDLFWLSEFTHFNGSDKILKKPIEKFWKTLLNSKTKKKWSDYDVLLESKTQLKKFI